MEETLQQTSGQTNGGTIISIQGNTTKQRKEKKPGHMQHRAASQKTC